MCFCDFATQHILLLTQNSAPTNFLNTLTTSINMSRRVPNNHFSTGRHYGYYSNHSLKTI